ncbi:uncharacterized protein LOC115929796 [Strongylocentrotus purpuratus]|uniref:Uncharacterized protein n=1 Tax=Strongylocentrotus purpuratus TaxID=7668 RepID=A0A7M7PWV2_STRPU|nr:uncharacterized protein LOC115929796 [Strongylocentrotus purpuratus]
MQTRSTSNQRLENEFQREWLFAGWRGGAYRACESSKAFEICESNVLGQQQHKYINRGSGSGQPLPVQIQNWRLSQSMATDGGRHAEEGVEGGLLSSERPNPHP